MYKYTSFLRKMLKSKSYKKENKIHKNKYRIKKYLRLTTRWLFSNLVLISPLNFPITVLTMRPFPKQHCWVYTFSVVFSLGCGSSLLRGLLLVVAGRGPTLLCSTGFGARGLGNCGPGFSSCVRLLGSSAQAQELWRLGLAALRHVGSSWTRDRTRVPCIGRQILYHWATRGALNIHFLSKQFMFTLLGFKVGLCINIKKQN